jgi:hypothetical protein
MTPAMFDKNGKIEMKRNAWQRCKHIYVDTLLFRGS